MIHASEAAVYKTISREYNVSEIVWTVIDVKSCDKISWRTQLLLFVRRIFVDVKKRLEKLDLEGPNECKICNFIKDKSCLLIIGKLKIEESL